MRALIHEDDRDHARLAVERAISAREQYDVESRVTQPAGGEVWVSAKGRAQYGPSGTALGMFATQ